MSTLSDRTNTPTPPADAAESLTQDLHAVLEDVQSLLQATASQSGDALDEIRARVASSVHTVKQRLQESEAKLLARSKAAIKATDDYVHDSLWQSAAIAAAVGFVLAWAIKRSHDA